MFFFLIAGLGFIRLKDKGKLIKYVNVWSLFLLLLSKFWNVVIWLESPFCDSLWMKKSWWERPDGLAMCVNDWPVSIFNFPDAAMNCRAQTRIRKPPLNGVPCDFMKSWLWSFHEVKKNKQTEKKQLALQTWPAQLISINISPLNLGSLWPVSLSHLCLLHPPTTQVVKVSEKWEEAENKLKNVGAEKGKLTLIAALFLIQKLLCLGEWPAASLLWNPQCSLNCIVLKYH